MASSRFPLTAYVVTHRDRAWLWVGAAKWLPSSVAKIDFERVDAPGVTVEGVGKVVLQPINAEDGAPAMIADAPVILPSG